MTLEITFEKAHLNVPEVEAPSLRSYIVFRAQELEEETEVRHGNEPVWDDNEFRCAEQDIFIFELKLAKGERSHPTDRTFGKGTWDFREFLRRTHPENFDDHVPYNEEVLLKSAENYAVVGRLFMRLKYIMGKLHIGGLMRFGQRIDLTNHELDISKIKLTDIPASPILGGSMMRSGVGAQGQPQMLLNTQLAGSNIVNQTMERSMHQQSPGVNQQTFALGSPQRIASPVEQFRVEPPQNQQYPMQQSSLRPALNQTTSAVVQPQLGYPASPDRTNQYQSATGLNFQTGSIGSNEVLGISSRGLDPPQLPSPMQQSTSQYPIQPTVIQSFSPHTMGTMYPQGAMSTSVGDQQFTLVKGLADRRNMFSWMDASDRQMEVAPGRVFNDFCKSRCRSNFPPYSRG